MREKVFGCKCFQKLPAANHSLIQLTTTKKTWVSILRVQGGFSPYDRDSRMQYSSSDMVVERHTHAGTSKGFPAPNHSRIQLTTEMKSPAVNPPRSGRILTLREGQQNAIHQQLGHGGRNADTTVTFRGFPAANHSLTQTTTPCYQSSALGDDMRLTKGAM